MAEADSVLSPETAGRAGGLGADVVGDMVDMVGAAVKGDSRRALRDGEDMARHGMSGEEAGMKGGGGVVSVTLVSFRLQTAHGA